LPSFAHASSVPSARSAANHGRAFGAGDVLGVATVLAGVDGVAGDAVAGTGVVGGAFVVVGGATLDGVLPGVAVVVKTGPSVVGGSLRAAPDPPQATSASTGNADINGKRRRFIEYDVVMAV
jgi:hypothetical protein